MVCAGGLMAELPPLVDRDLFFGEVEISAAQISPDGQYISFLKPYKGARNIWVKKASEPFTAAKPVTAETKRPIPAYFWSRDGKYLLFVQDQAGDENFNVFAVNPSEPLAEGADVPKTRNLTDMKGVRAALYAVPRTDPDVIYIGLNDRDKAWHDLYKVKISTGERTLMRKNTNRLTGWVFDHAATPRLATRSAENGDTEILRADADKFTKIYSCDALEECGPLQFDKDNKRVWIQTNKGDSVDLIELATMDPATGQTQTVESDPMHRVDLGNALFSDRTHELIATSYEDDRERYYWKNKAFEADYKWLQGKLPRMDLAFTSHTNDENVWLVSAHSDVEPGETYLFDRKAKKLTLQYKVREQLPREALSPMKAIRYKSSDGLEIPAYLTLPKGLPEKGLPLVVFPHGGPWGRDSWGYATFAQFLANRGYAVLSPNFRASTGYGKKFLNAGNREWGQKMQDDLTYGVRYLVDEGIVDIKRVAIAGGSYGGYATLAGVAFTPDVYAAAVAIVAPSNLITLLDSIPPYWEAGRKMFYLRMGDPTTPEGKKQLERQSPLNSANKIRTPLMVVQGANDPRVNKRESDQIVIALRDRKFPVEYLVADDEGHGFRRPVNNLAMVAAMEKFLAKHIDGRYQEALTPETSKRLKEITVDPATVTLAKVSDATNVGAPEPAGPLTPGVSKYKASIQAGGQSMALELSSEVKEEADGWVVTDVMQSPMGEAKDTAVLDKKTLVSKKRSVQQGPMSIDLTYNGNKVTGTMKMGGPEKAVDVDAGGPVFMDSAGATAVVAALPLKNGYATQFRNFDLMKQKAKLQDLKVTGEETVTVPAGTFEAWKVEITSADGGADKQTIWVSKSSPKTVKFVGGDGLHGRRDTDGRTAISGDFWSFLLLRWVGLEGWGNDQKAVPGACFQRVGGLSGYPGG
jgi:dipeptidyl aminopeptidase/acylaminoacyl peptidase